MKSPNSRYVGLQKNLSNISSVSSEDNVESIFYLTKCSCATLIHTLKYEYFPCQPLIVGWYHISSFIKSVIYWLIQKYRWFILFPFLWFFFYQLYTFAIISNVPMSMFSSMISMTMSSLFFHRIIINNPITFIMN